MSSNDRIIQEARDRAESLYAEGMLCSEVLILVANEMAGSPFSSDISRLGTALGIGMGNSGCSCGALSGAIVGAGIMAGRVGADESCDPALDISSELHARFRSQEGAACCRAITSRLGGMDTPERREHCTRLTGACAAWLAELALDRDMVSTLSVA